MRKEHAAAINFNDFELLVSYLARFMVDHIPLFACILLSFMSYSFGASTEAAVFSFLFCFFCILQILPYVNGFNHIQKIAMESDVNIDIVMICVQHLM